MKVKELHQDEVPVLEISGRLDGAADNVKLVTAVKELVREGEREIVVDLERVRMLTSSGLGILLRARNRLDRDDGKMHLCGLHSRGQEVLYVTQTRSLFEVHDTREQAVQAVQLAH